MLRKFLEGTAMSALLLVIALLFLALPVLGTTYVAVHYGPLYGGCALFASICVVCGAMHVVFD